MRAGSTLLNFKSGGVFIDSGSFTMKGGTINGNSAGYYGGGVFVYQSGVNSFTKQEGDH
ncbi:MAG: hypothetical protein LBD93_10050 [Treponema sp.]|jgi:hypothetical protein|nr:hypothetical protein [Treponema sp.]